MATDKKPTSAKKRTATKRPAAKTKKTQPKKATVRAQAKARPAAKTTKKPAVKASSKKTTKKLPVKTSTKKVQNRDSFKPFKYLHITGFLLSAIVIVLVIMFGGDRITSLNMLYLTQNQLAENSQLLTGLQGLLEVNLKYILVAGLAVAAIWNLALVTILKDKYKQQLGQSAVSLRWVGYAVTTPVLVIFTGMLLGVRDIASLLLLVAVVESAVLLGYLSEKYNLLGNLTSWKQKLVLDAVLLPWIVLGLYLFGTYAYGLVEYEAGIYASLGVLFFATLALAVIRQKQIAGTGKEDSLVNEQLSLILHGVVLLTISSLIFL